MTNERGASSHFTRHNILQNLLLRFSNPPAATMQSAASSTSTPNKNTSRPGTKKSTRLNRTVKRVEIAQGMQSMCCAPCVVKRADFMFYYVCKDAKTLFDFGIKS